MRLPFRRSHDGSNRRASGRRNIAMMRACLVPGRAVTLGDEGTDRPGILDLPVFREADRVPALGFDLELVMGSSEGCATPFGRATSAPPRQTAGRARSRSATAAPKSPQQRSIKPESQSILSKIVAWRSWNSLPIKGFRSPPSASKSLILR
jgi:hypothetical protein